MNEMCKIFGYQTNMAIAINILTYQNRVLVVTRYSFFFHFEFIFILIFQQITNFYNSKLLTFPSFRVRWIFIRFFLFLVILLICFPGSTIYFENIFEFIVVNNILAFFAFIQIGQLRMKFPERTPFLVVFKGRPFEIAFK